MNPPPGTTSPWSRGRSPQKLTVLRQDDHHLGLFVRGSVSQIAGILGVKFARGDLPRPGIHLRPHGARPFPRRSRACSSASTGCRPHLRPHKHAIQRKAQTNAGAGSAEYRPKQIAQAYNATALYNDDIVGSGQTIAIVIDVFPATSDLELFWTSSGINQSLANIQFIQTVPGQLADPSGEETLDTEWASGMAPGAKVRVYAATDLGNTDLDQTYQQVLDDATNHPELNIHQMTMSFGSGRGRHRPQRARYRPQSLPRADGGGRDLLRFVRRWRIDPRRQRRRRRQPPAGKSRERPERDRRRRDFPHSQLQQR